MVSNARSRVMDIIQGIGYGIAKTNEDGDFTAAKAAKPIAIKDAGAERYELGFLYSNGRVACPTKALFSNSLSPQQDVNTPFIFNQHAVSSGKWWTAVIYDEDWTKDAESWIDRNKPCSSFDLPNIIDITSKIPLSDIACKQLHRQLEHWANGKNPAVSIVECHTLFSINEKCFEQLFVDGNLERWIIEKDLLHG